MRTELRAHRRPRTAGAIAFGMLLNLALLMFAMALAVADAEVWK
jgi:hypothetical protein